MRDLSGLACFAFAVVVLACGQSADPEAPVTSEAVPKGAGFEGVWRAEGSLTLTVAPIVDGEMTARLADDGGPALQLEGQAEGNRVRGDATDEGGMELGFSAKLEGGRLALEIVPVDPDGNPIPGVAETLWFSRGAAEGTATPPVVAAQPAPRVPETPHAVTAPPTSAPSQRNVYVNRTRVSAATLQAMEAQYGSIQDGRYWYDAACGAWGVEGGPAAGFLVAGLNLPGPMPADISRGGTGIWINGREVHPHDKAALHQIFGTTIPGRYWLDAQGNLGPEGGAAIANLASAIQASRGGGGSVTHGYGSAGGARGTVGGGMYSGRTATGKSVFWYPGM